MKPNRCAQCGAEIEGKGVRFRSRDFCDDDCLDEFGAQVANREGSTGGDLEEDDDSSSGDLEIDEDY
jgi:hypothetical protein